MVNKKSKNKVTTIWGNCFDGTLVILTDCLNGTALHNHNSNISDKGNSCKKPY